jgi:UDP-glucose 4-epimerase
MKRILITGITGFVGKVTERYLLAQGYDVVGAVRKKTPKSPDHHIEVGPIDENTDWTDALNNIDGVVHLAARVHVMQETAENPLEAFRSVNVRGSENLATQSVKAGVQKLIYLSSIKVNGEKTTDHPFRADDRFIPEDPYGLS